MATLQSIVGTFNGYDLDGDGVNEIQSLAFLSPRDPRLLDPTQAVDLHKKLVLVIVESRLFDSIPGSQFTANDLVARLVSLQDDLHREDFTTCFLEMAPYEGPDLRDCSTLLAMREFLKAVYASFPNLDGVLLVGSFPNAAVVRLGPEHGTGDLAGASVECYREGGFMFRGSSRYDIVLADLNGNWRNIYKTSASLNRHTYFVTGNTKVTTDAAKTQVTLTNPTIVLNEAAQPTPGPVTINDFLFMQDAAVTQSTLPNGDIQVVFSLVDRNPEIASEDATSPNPIAVPEICVSRINARSIAIQPPSSAKAIDANGRPQTTTVSFEDASWTQDPALERRLLIDYFDRNHRFRTGEFAAQPFTISTLESAHYGTADLEDGLTGLNAPRDPIVPNATVLDFIRWLKQPALFRVVSSHACAQGTYLITIDDSQVAAAEAEAGGSPWRWVELNGTYEPSFKGDGSADLHLFRTLWENGVLRDTPPSVAIHLGCDVNSVTNVNVPNYDPSYAPFQNAEAFLFCGNQLAVLCHIAWWDHGPSGFGEAFGASATATFGDGWRNFSRTWSQDASLAGVEYDRKRSYEWSVVGDWTLRKQYAKQKAPGTQVPGTWSDIDLLSILLRDDIYVKLHLPDPGPDGAFRSDIHERARALTIPQKRAALGRVKQLGAYLREVEKQLDGEPEKANSKARTGP